MIVYSDDDGDDDDDDDDDDRVPIHIYDCMCYRMMDLCHFSWVATWICHQASHLFFAIQFFCWYDAWDQDGNATHVKYSQLRRIIIDRGIHKDVLT